MFYCFTSVVTTMWNYAKNSAIEASPLYFYCSHYKQLNSDGHHFWVKKSNFDWNNPDKNYFDDKLQEIDSPYFSFESFRISLRQHLFHLPSNIKNLSKNIGKLNIFLASFNGHFRIAVVSETWCDKKANKNSILKIPNYSTLHEKKKKT